MSRELKSTAVMARRTEPSGGLDYFPTPPWATRAFCEHVLPAVWPHPDRFSCGALDPACGEGHMSRVLAEYFDYIHESDIFDYGQAQVANFLREPGCFAPADWIITNPPFNLAAEFVDRALSIAQRGVAMLIRMQFIEGEKRFKRLFNVRPPHLMAQYSERVPMHRGRWVINGKTATAYTWLVWLKHPEHDRIRAAAKYGSGFQWIPPSKWKLTRPDDVLRFQGCQDLPKTHAAMKLMSAIELEEAA